MNIEARVCGIPALLEVITFNVTPPCRGSAWDAPSDIDYWGDIDIEYNVLDRRGRAAPWLEAKVDADEDERLQEIILEALS